MKSIKNLGLNINIGSRGAQPAKTRSEPESELRKQDQGLYRPLDPEVLLEVASEFDESEIMDKIEAKNRQTIENI